MSNGQPRYDRTISREEVVEIKSQVSGLARTLEAITKSLEYNKSISRDEFVELKAQVLNLIRETGSITTGFESSQKERDVSRAAEIARIESESKSRFEKLEEAFNNKNLADTEGRRWLIGTLTGLVMAFMVVGGWWTNTIKESVVAEVGNQLVIVKEQNAASLKDREELNSKVSKNSQDISKLDTEVAANNARYATKLIEIETQFAADAQSRNIQFANQQRLNSNFQNALSAMGAKIPPYPFAPFYNPDISRSGKNQVE